MSPNLPNPYQVLGVDEKAQTADIKKPPRQLARENHPDSNAGDTDKESRFKDISAAYEILGDPDKRAQYDALKSAGPGAIPEGVFDLGDLFAQMFGGRSGAGPGVGATPFGGNQNIRYEVRQGPRGQGHGRRSAGPQGFNFPDLGSVFGDFGNVPGAPGAAGQAPPAKKRKVKRVTKRKLSDGSSAQVKGLDLHSELRVDFDEAIAGASKTVATKNGKAKITIPAGSSSGTRLRLRGKGLRSSATKVGDHYLTVQIDVPKNISDEARRQLARLMETVKKDQS